MTDQILKIPSLGEFCGNVSRIIHVKKGSRLNLSQINTTIKDDFQIVLLLLCLEGHSVNTGLPTKDETVKTT